MLANQRAAYVLLGAEPELDAYDAAAATAAMRGAEFVVALSAFKTTALDYADVLLPIAPFSETAGSYVNMEGRLQSFHGVVKPQGEARPAWKVLRVLGNLLSLGGFDYDTAEAVRADAVHGDLAAALNNAAPEIEVKLAVAVVEGLERIGETPLYQLDPIVRLSPALQATVDAASPVAWMGSEWMTRLGLTEGSLVRVSQGDATVELPLRRDDRLAVGALRVAAAHPLTAVLGARLGPISVEKL
jgi:NADH-quinone oxidoreductase subunit G